MRANQFFRIAGWFGIALVALGLPAAAQTQGVSCSVASSDTPYLATSNYAALAGDVVITCTGGTPIAAGRPVPNVVVQVALNANYTGRTVGGVTESLLLIDDPAPANQIACATDAALCGWTAGSPGPNVFASTLQSPTTLAFQNVPLDPPGHGGLRRFRITNIRVDAAHWPAPRPVYAFGVIMAQVSMTGVTMVIDTARIGNAFTDIQASVMGANGETPADAAAGTVLPNCTATANQRISTLRFAQVSPRQFRPRSQAPLSNVDTSPVPLAQNVPGTVFFSESGFYNPGFPVGNQLNRAGLADSGTRLQAALSGIPAGATVYVATVPVTFTNGVPAQNANTEIQARLISSATGAFNPVAVSTALDGIPVAALNIVNGNAVAVWEILANPANAAVNADFPVWISYPAGTQPGAVAVRAQPGPSSAVNTASDTAPIPRYVDDTTAKGLFAIRPTCAAGPYFVTTNLAGQGFSVDGVEYKTPQGFNWTPGTSHTLSAIPAAQNLTSYRYAARNWSDGGAPTHTIVVPGAGTTYTAHFQQQFKLDLSASPADWGAVQTVPVAADGYFDSGSDVQIKGIANTGYVFADFQGALSGSVNPQTLHVTGAGKVVAEFATLVPSTSALSVTPASGSDLQGLFQSVYRGARGAQSLLWVEFLIAAAPDGGGQPFCFVHYDVRGQAFWLYSDAYGFFVGPVKAGVNSSDLTGSDCTLSTALSSVDVSGDRLQFNAQVLFKVTGDRSLYLRAMDDGNFDTGWVPRGIFNQHALPVSYPGLTQQSGTGSVETFRMTETDPVGFGGLKKGWEQLLVAVDQTGGGQPFCFVHYDRAASQFWMYSSDVGFFLGPVAPGTASNALDSSACTVDTAASRVTERPDGVDLEIKVTMKPAMSGLKLLHTRIQDVTGRLSSWGFRGTHQVP
ncbi:hypothetical protein [Paludibaculum fermentans]|uniref:Uncharacterized protein n=1 Tax=Paludibaculum fermentans TaxID=1473598 RepID=A0A7S7NWE0_PALFE|nr:hypothetical protein [Paludibaculum fermentans]QOY91037.1 hypothetical protein IRI77_14155 [Paludibaculum fermentans]